MPSPARKRRGTETQRAIAEFLAFNGYPYATATGAGESGKDVKNTPGLALEIKARTRFDPLAWLRQARGNAKPGELAAVCFRPNGMGPATVSEWPILLRLGDFTELLAAVQSLNGDEETQ